MPRSFTPQLIPRFNERFLSYINENFQALSRLLAGSPKETIGSTAPSSPYIGEFWFDTSTGTPKWWDGSNWTPDKPWTTYTPTVTQTVSVSITTNTSSTESRYIEDGRTITVTHLITITSSGTSGGVIKVSAPKTARFGGNKIVGSGYLYDSSANIVYPLLVSIDSTGNFTFYSTDVTSNNFIAAAGSFTVAIANGDALTFVATYERA